MDVVADRLHRDLFPAEVTLDGVLLASQARVFITGTEVLVYEAKEDRSIVQVARLDIDQAPMVARGVSFFGSVQLVTPVGPLSLNRARGCGCHSPLKAMDPPVAW